MVESYINYAFQSKLYIWKKSPKKREEAKKTEVMPASAIPKLSGSKLKDLAWSLDVLDVSKKNENNI